MREFGGGAVFRRRFKQRIKINFDRFQVVWMDRQLCGYTIRCRRPDKSLEKKKKHFLSRFQCKAFVQIADDQYSEDRVKRCLLQSSGFCHDTQSNIQITAMHQTSTAVNICLFFPERQTK